MSHYSVAVFSDGTKSVEELLETFNECTEVAPYVAETKEEIIERVRKEIKYYSETTYAKWKANPEKYEEGCRKDDSLAHLEYVKNVFPESLKWTDEECYRDGIKWHEEQINEDGSIVSTYNPNSKWDWYEIGGRFKNCLKTKKCEYVNSAKVCEIDFSDNTENYMYAKRFWEINVEHDEIKENENKYKEDFYALYKDKYYLDNYHDKENYAKSMSAFYTFAVVTPDGDWHEQGEMGLWGLAKNEEPGWELKYKERFIDTANPDWTMTIVDCHI